MIIEKKCRWTHGKHDDVSHSGYSWCRTQSSSAYLHQEGQGFDKLDCPIVLKSLALGPTVPQKAWNLHPLCQWWHIDPISLGVHELLVFLMCCGALSVASVCGWAGKFYCLTITYKFMCWITPDNIQGRQSYGKTENYYKAWSPVLLSSWKLYFLKSKFEFDLMFSRSSGVNCSRCKSFLHLTNRWCIYRRQGSLILTEREIQKLRLILQDSGGDFILWLRITDHHLPHISMPVPRHTYTLPFPNHLAFSRIIQLGSELKVKLHLSEFEKVNSPKEIKASGGWLTPKG